MILELISISLSIKLSQLSQISAVTWSGLELQPGVPNFACIDPKNVPNVQGGPTDDAQVIRLPDSALSLSAEHARYNLE